MLLLVPAGIISIFISLERMRNLSFVLCAVAAVVVLPIAAELPAFQHDEAYEQGAYGKYVTQKYMSTSVVAPHLNILQWSPQCGSSLLTFLAPRGYSVQEPQITILDHQGHLVWTRGWAGQQLFNLRVQKYKGENYLTFWAGKTYASGHGAGDYYMVRAL